MASSPERNSEQFTQTISQYEGLNIGFSLFGAPMPQSSIAWCECAEKSTTPDLKPSKKNFENKKVRKTAQQRYKINIFQKYQKRKTMN